MIVCRCHYITFADDQDAPDARQITLLPMSRFAVTRYDAYSCFDAEASIERRHTCYCARHAAITPWFFAPRRAFFHGRAFIFVDADMRAR